ncbi:MAG: hypothetical protein ACRD98_03985 [Nitrososphaera sp.]
MEDRNKIPRWIVENDPSWEKSIDSNLGMLRWTRKGSGVQATCSPTDMFCEVLGSDKISAGMADLRVGVERMSKDSAAGIGDIRRYLSSRYLNPGVGGPRLDLRRERRT